VTAGFTQKCAKSAKGSGWEELHGLRAKHARGGIAWAILDEMVQQYG